MNEGGEQARRAGLAASPATSSAHSEPPQPAHKPEPVTQARPATSPPAATGNKSASKAPSATGNKPPVQATHKPAAATGNKSARLPGKKADKPLKMPGYHWRSDGAGWQLRRTVIIDGKRSQPYVAHLSRTVYRTMQRAHRGEKLAEALAAWIAEREGEKA